MLPKRWNEFDNRYKESLYEHLITTLLLSINNVNKPIKNFILGAFIFNPSIHLESFSLIEDYLQKTKKEHLNI